MTYHVFVMASIAMALCEKKTSGNEWNSNWVMSIHTCDSYPLDVLCCGCGLVDNFKSPSLKLTLLFLEQIVHEAQGKSSDLQDSLQGVSLCRVVGLAAEPLPAKPDTPWS
jgi:hypothetical protein